MNKLGVRISVLVIGSILIGQACAAIEHIEMNDANRNLLNLELSKGVESLQNALKDEFQFKHVDAVKRFLNYCDYVTQVMGQTSDSDYNGLAAKIKALLAEPQVAVACRLSVAKMEELVHLADGFHAAPLDHLSTVRFESLVALQKEMEANESAKLVLGHLFQRTIDQLGHSLLVDSTRDFAVMVNEKAEGKSLFDFETKYREGCTISLVAPICQLVRRSSRPGVQALGADLADFKRLIMQDDQEKIKPFEEASNVTMEQLRESCQELDKKMAFRTMKKISGYQAAGFLSEQQIQEQAKASELFDFYMQLFETCLAVDNL